MRICYVDEAGCPGTLPSATSNIQPVLVVAGLIVAQDDVAQLTRDFVDLKRTFYPRECKPAHRPLHWVLNEIKGSDVRANAIDPNRNRRRHALGFLDKVLDLLESRDARLVGRVWIKGVGEVIKTTAIYTSSTQYIAEWFDRHLAARGDAGVVICDSRSPGQNAEVSHSIFTGKYASAGDRYPRIVEIPTFGHSQTHAGMQIADLVCSALLFPMAVDAFCAGHITSVHVRAGYGALRSRYGARLERLQYRATDPTRFPLRTRGGITVDDALGRAAGLKRSGATMFRPPVALPPGAVTAVTSPTAPAVPAPAPPLAGT